MFETYLSREEWKAVNETNWTERGAELRQLRNTFGYSLSEAAELTGFSASTLSRFENGMPVQRARVIEKSYGLLARIRSTENLAHIMFDSLTADGVSLRFADVNDLSYCDGVAGVNLSIDDSQTPQASSNVINLSEYRR